MRFVYHEGMSEKEARPVSLRHEALLADGTLLAGFTRRRKGERWCGALEARYAAHRHDHALLEGYMQCRPHDGRPPADTSLHALGGVNGQEVRVTDRWDEYLDPTKDYGCYSILPDGSRRLFETYADGVSRTVAEPVHDAAAEYAARLARFGAVSYE